MSFLIRLAVVIVITWFIVFAMPLWAWPLGVIAMLSAVFLPFKLK